MQQPPNNQVRCERAVKLFGGTGAEARVQKRKINGRGKGAESRRGVGFDAGDRNTTAGSRTHPADTCESTKRSSLVVVVGEREEVGVSNGVVGVVVAVVSEAVADDAGAEVEVVESLRGVEREGDMRGRCGGGGAGEWHLNLGARDV